MWKQKPESGSHPIPVATPEPVRAVSSSAVAQFGPRPHSLSATADQATLSQGIVVRGEISGVDGLNIDGTVEGTIHIPGERVTVGRHGRVVGPKSDGATSCISAREIVIMGTVTGNITAADRVDIRGEASLAGNVSTARVSIEDGAYFRGGIDIRREPQPAETPSALETVEAVVV